jgi:hypothetical protein
MQIPVCWCTGPGPYQCQSQSQQPDCQSRWLSGFQWQLPVTERLTTCDKECQHWDSDSGLPVTQANKPSSHGSESTVQAWSSESSCSVTVRWPETVCQCQWPPASAGESDCAGMRTVGSTTWITASQSSRTLQTGNYLGSSYIEFCRILFRI